MRKRAILFVVIFLAIYIAHAFLNPIPTPQFDKTFEPNYGVSYSFEQAAWYGLDPQKGFVDLVSQNKFKWVRLSFFWDHPSTMVSGPNGSGQIALGNLNDLEFAIREAGKRNIKVIVALGAKTPYYPEFHVPERLKGQLTFGERITTSSPIADDILEVDRKVVEALASFDNIINWQVENEPLTKNVNAITFDYSFLEKEIEVVRNADPKKRGIILANAAGGQYSNEWKKLLNLLKPGDAFATNAFFKTQGTYLINSQIASKQIKVGWPLWLVWPVHSWLFLSPDIGEIKKEVEKKNLEFWIMEMQAEPYIRVLEDAKGEKFSFTASDIEKANNFLRSKRVKSIGFWGANFWQFKKSNGDESWSTTVKSIIN